VIQIVYWYAPADWWSYMEHSERVNFRIMEEFERMGMNSRFHRRRRSRRTRKNRQLQDVASSYAA